MTAVSDHLAAKRSILTAVNSALGLTTLLAEATISRSGVI